MDNLTRIEKYFHKWQTEGGKIRISACAWPDEDTDTRPKLVIPLSPTSIAAYMLGSKMGYQIVSPNIEDMPAATLRTSLMEMCGDIAFACVSEVQVRYVDGTTQTVYAEENWDMGFTSTLALRRDADNHPEITNLTAKVFLSNPNSPEVERSFYEALGVLVYEVGVDFDVAFATQYSEDQPDLENIIDLVAHIRSEVGMPYETAKEVEHLATAAENVYFARRVEEAAHAALRVDKRSGLTIKAAMDMFRISNEAIKEYAGTLT